MSQLPDFRIRFQAPLINFDTEVGSTDTDIDNYPAAGQQPRYDWMRLVLVGLLTAQASFYEPTVFGEGTFWFNLNTGTYMIRKNGAWVSLTEAIQTGTNRDGSPQLLSDLLTTINNFFGVSAPNATFSGKSETLNQTLIEIPSALQQAASLNSRPLVFKNGNLVDPRLCEYGGSPIITSVRLLGGVALDSGDFFTVLMVNITPQFFYPSTVVV